MSNRFMDAPSPTLGVAAAPPPPVRQEAAPLTVGTTTPALTVPASPWPRSAQWATAGLLVLALGLLGWHACNGLRWGGRPTDVVPDSGPTDRIDLNRADHAQLLQLPGVGDATANHIEEYRRSHNGFQSVEELRQVHGIGPALLDRLRPLIAVEPYEAPEDDGDNVPAAAPPPPASRKDAPAKAAKAAPRAATAGKKKGDGPAAPINVNRASADELQELPGIGPALSGRIIQTREQRPFQSVDDLRHVPGIGPKTMEHLRPFVTVGGP